MYYGASIVGTVRNDKKVPILVFVFDEGLVALESTDAELLASKKTLRTYKEFDTWRDMFESSAKRESFTAFSRTVANLKDCHVSTWPQNTITKVHWYKVGGWLKVKVLEVERRNHSTLFVLYAANERAELVPLRDYCKKAFESRYTTDKI